MYYLKLVFYLDFLLGETYVVHFYASLDCSLGLNVTDSVSGGGNETRFVVRHAETMIVFEFPIFCGLGHLYFLLLALRNDLLRSDLSKTRCQVLRLGVLWKQLRGSTSFQVVEVNEANDIFLFFYRNLTGGFLNLLIHTSSLGGKGSLGNISESF